MSKFAATIENWVKETEQRMLAVTFDALNNMVNDMQERVSEGGRMRVDTGFLRASGRAALNQIPTGEGQKPADAPTGQYTGVYDTWDGQPLLATLFDMKLGDTFYWGWTANYAAARETYDGFMDTRLQNWQIYIDSSTNKLRDKVNP